MSSSIKLRNNKEKREYISCLHLLENQCFPEEIMRIRTVLSKCPDALFKYRSFDKWTLDILKNKYAYLAPVKDLDDPFDCLSDFDVSNVMNISKKEITERFLKRFIKEFKIPVTDKQIDTIKQYKSAFKPGDDFESDRIYEALKNEGIPEDKIGELVLQYQNFVNISDAYKDNGEFERFGEVLMNPKDRIGVCSLSEINDNKVMWSLYGKEYKGYCIEYHVQKTNKARRFLFPVIYSRKPNNSVIEKLFDTEFAIMERNMNSFNNPFLIDTEIGQTGAIYELFCTKDIDWKYQKEWRLVGNARYHFKEVDIKAVYLGFAVSKINEKKMLSYAKRYKFDLYKMKAPNGKKRIKFISLFKVEN